MPARGIWQFVFFTGFWRRRGWHGSCCNYGRGAALTRSWWGRKHQQEIWPCLAVGGMSMEGGTFSGGVACSVGVAYLYSWGSHIQWGWLVCQFGWHILEGLILVLTWLIAGGVASPGGSYILNKACVEAEPQSAPMHVSQQVKKSSRAWFSVISLLRKHCARWGRRAWYKDEDFCLRPSTFFAQETYMYAQHKKLILCSPDMCLIGTGTQNLFSEFPRWDAVCSCSLWTAVETVPLTSLFLLRSTTLGVVGSKPNLKEM